MKKSILIVFFFVAYANYSQAADPIIIKKNNISIRPFIGNSEGVGMGISFERYLDSSQNFSVVLPVDYLFFSSLNNRSYYYYNIESSGFSVMPNFRIYFKTPRTFNWYIGFGPYYATSNIHNSNYSFESTEMSFGTMTNFGFKATIQRKVTLSTDFGFGIAVLNQLKTVNPNNQFNQNTNEAKVISSFAFQIGYIF